MSIKEFRGVENLVFAEVTSDSAAGIVHGTVKPLAGVAKITKEVETSSETHYYDNKPAVVINSAGADKVTISASAIDLSVLAELTGQTYDTTSKMLVEGQPQNKYFAIGYKTKDTDGNERYVWRLKGTFSIPKEEANTSDDGTDANGQELEYTGIETTYKFTKTGKSAKAIVVEGATAAGDAFFSAVQTPDSTLPAVTPTPDPEEP